MLKVKFSKFTEQRQRYTLPLNTCELPFFPKLITVAAFLALCGRNIRGVISLKTLKTEEIKYCAVFILILCRK